MIDLRKGDCLEIMKDIPDKSIDMILCDLPYGTTACKWDTIIPFEPLWEQYNRIIKDNGVIALFGVEPFSSQLRMSNLKKYKYDIVWKKQQATNPMFAKKGIMKIHENISVFYKKQPTYNPQMSYGNKNYSSFKSDKSNIGEVYGNLKSIHRECNDGSRYPVSIVQYNTERTKYHPTQKPVALLEYFIKTYTNEGETVLDNCMGSGSTGVACKHTNRSFIGIELDDNYFEIAKKRIEETGNLGQMTIFDVSNSK